MKLIKSIVVLTFTTLTVSAYGQSVPKWSGETSLLLTVYRLGSYQKERPTFFLEQNFDRRVSDRFSLGAGFGVNAYPALLAFPAQLNAKYHFKIKSTPFSIMQSYGRNIKLSDVFFNSNRYLGELRANISVGKVDLTPRIGYNYLWDRYHGRNLGFLLGVGVEYRLNQNS